MANSTLYQKVVSISPLLEMLARRIYYFSKEYLPQNVTKIKINDKSQKKKETNNFDLVIDYLIKCGLEKGDIIVVHSSFSELKKFNLSPNEIIDKFLNYLGPDGTLAMPAIPIYPNEIGDKVYSDDELIKSRFEYDPSSTRIWTGALPKALIQNPNSNRSLHPLNSMVALGNKAEEMMKDNHKDQYPNGPKSSWNFCAKSKAFVVGLGVDLTHSLTMIHVAEDVLGEKWYVKDWYQDRVFMLKTGKKTEELNVKERKYKWGKFHFGERTLAKDLSKSNILKSATVENTLIETLRADELVSFLNSKNKSGYPYFWVKKYLK